MQNRYTLLTQAATSLPNYNSTLQDKLSIGLFLSSACLLRHAPTKSAPVREQKAASKHQSESKYEGNHKPSICIMHISQPHSAAQEAMKLSHYLGYEQYVSSNRFSR